MVLKRQGIDLSDSEAENSPPKRLRRNRTQDGDDDEPESSQPPPTNNTAGDPPAAIDVSDDSDVEINENVSHMEIEGEDEAELEERIRQQHLDKIRAEFRQNMQKSGRVGSLGIIQKIDLTNFMCHKRLTIRLGDRINFVIGHNGSGKSAILTALTVALGAKASITGRASGIKSFIKHGESVAEIEVTIKNCGPEAFKPDQYGNTIIVVRRITKEGSSSYKLKSGESNKVISTKREELLAMCEQMQLQVDNPMNVLTQDSARQFLSASHPREKYALFLKGTHLTQLSEEYQIAASNINKTYKTLQQKKTVIPELKNKRDQWMAKVREAKKAENLHHDLEKIKGELSWALVEEKRKELEKKGKEGEKMETEIRKLKAKLEKDEENLRAADTEKESLTSGENGEEQQQNLMDKKKDLGDRIKGFKYDLAQAKAHQKDMNNDLKSTNDSIKDYEERIAKEKEKLREAQEGKQEKLLEQIQVKEDEIKSKRDRMEELQGQIRTHSQGGQAKRDELGKVQAEDKRLQNEIMQCDAAIQHWSEAATGDLNKFGKNMRSLLQEIERQQWTGRRPVGPFGRHIKVKDSQWVSLLQAQIGRHMYSFVVENSADKFKLLNMLKQSNNGSISVVVAQCDLFDFSRGEPPASFTTALRVLEFTDQWVMRVMINTASIEKNLLAPSRELGQRALDELKRQTGRGGLAWTSDNFNVRVYDDAGGSTILSERVPDGDQRKMLFGEGNPRAEIEKYQTKKAAAEAEKIENLKTMNKAKADGAEHDRLGRACQQELNGLRRIVEHLSDEKRRLQEEVDDAGSVNIVALEQALEEHEKSRQSIIDQFQPVAERITVATARITPLAHELDEVRKQLDDAEARKMEHMDLVEKAVKAQVQAKGNVAHWQGKITRAETLYQKYKEELQCIDTEFKEWTNAASQHFDKVESPRKKDLLEKEVKRLEAQIKQGQQARGYTLEQAQSEFMETEKALQKAEVEISETSEFVKNLHSSLNIRMKQWHHMRSYMSVRTKEYFQFLLTYRGYSGTLDIDHQSQELNLKVRTDDQTGGTKDKDPRALSGGEKSYATICLLLALWKSLECPIRCLDEFDVFMDNINRRVSLKLMIEQAKNTHEKQHILITPQDLPNIAPDNCVKIQRLSDPERGQGVLAAH